MTAEKGFTGFISDFAGSVKENGQDIWATTKELEALFENGLDFLVDSDNLDRIRESVQQLFQFLTDQFSDLAAGSTKALDEQMKKMIDAIEDSAGVDLSQVVNPDQLLNSFSDLIPDEAFPDELKGFYQNIKAFANEIPLDNLRVNVKQITSPLPIPKKDNTSLNSSFDLFDNTLGTSQQTASQPGNAGASGSTDDDASIFDDLFDSLSKKLTEKIDVFENFADRMETILTRSEFLAEFEEKKETFTKKVTEGKLSIRELIEETGKLFASLMLSAVETAKFIFDAITEVLDSFIVLLKEVLFLKPGALFESIGERLGFEIDKISLATLPIGIICTPLTVFHKAIDKDGERLKFEGSFSQELTKAEGKNLAYGLFQIAKGIIAVGNLIIEKIIDGSDSASDESKDERKFWFGESANLLTVLMDVGGQLSSIPSDFPQSGQERFKDGFFGNKIWYYQWAFNVAVPAAEIITKVGLRIGLLVRKRQFEKETNNARKTQLDQKIKGIERGAHWFELGTIIMDTLREIVHFGLFMGLFGKEESSENAITDKEFSNLDPQDMATPSDPRIQGTYFLDSLPGIVSGIIGGVKWNIDRKNERKPGKVLDRFKTQFLNQRTRQGLFKPEWRNLNNKLATVVSKISAYKREVQGIIDSFPRLGTGIAFQEKKAAIAKAKAVLEDELFKEIDDTVANLRLDSNRWNEYCDLLTGVDYLGSTVGLTRITANTSLDDLVPFAIRSARVELGRLDGKLDTFKKKMNFGTISNKLIIFQSKVFKFYMDSIAPIISFPDLNEQSRDLKNAMFNIRADIDHDFLNSFNEATWELNKRITKVNDLTIDLNKLSERNIKSPGRKSKSKYLSYFDVGFTTLTQIIYGALFMSTALEPRVEVEEISTVPDKEEFTVGETVTLTIKFTEPIKLDPVPKIRFFPPGTNTPDSNDGTALTRDENDFKKFSVDYVVQKGSDIGYTKEGIGYTFITITGEEAASGNKIFPGIQTLKVKKPVA